MMLPRLLAGVRLCGQRNLIQPRRLLCSQSKDSVTPSANSNSGGGEKPASRLKKLDQTKELPSPKDLLGDFKNFQQLFKNKKKASFKASSGKPSRKKSGGFASDESMGNELERHRSYDFKELIPLPSALNLSKELGIRPPEKIGRGRGKAVARPSAKEMAAQATPLFDRVDEIEANLRRASNCHNAFHDAIQWTLDGKLRQFPVDNEAYDTEDRRVGFHEHIFLEHHLDMEMLERAAPLRRFMEVVCMGLANNPHFTLQQKKDHLTWYMQYFKDKVDSVAAYEHQRDEATST